MTARIEDYALIGDCQSAALVGRNGSVDWLCMPRFDSEACFAALLGTPEHGRWLIAPSGNAAFRTERRYRDGTLILETDFHTPEGSARLIDFMPIESAGVSNLVRIVLGQSGTVSLRTEVLLRFDYGESIPWLTHVDDRTVRAVAGPDMVTLHGDVPLHAGGNQIVADFQVHAGQTTQLVLTYSASHLPNPAPLDADKALAETEAFWREWSGRCQYRGDWLDAVQRSLITLKALTHLPTGGIVAAPTTSLPELIGGSRNWDYRFCWLRDATLTLLALMDAGYRHEACAFRDWLLRAVAGNPAAVRIMYGVTGERRLPELELAFLPGYEGSRPVRIGNAAAGQLQHDVYGEIADVLYQARHQGLPGSDADWSLQRALIETLESNWDEPDRGIWEIRGESCHFTHSKAMVWLALERTVRIAQEFGLEGPIDRWLQLRDQIHREVCSRGYSQDLGTFTQAYGSKNLDASLLLLPLIGFLPASDPRIVGTIRAIERKLLIDGFVVRYDTTETADGLPPGEGAFLACSFWLADNYVLQGRMREARDLFQRLLSVRNDLGLLAEQYDPRRKRLLGNFPQAFSHLALINTAFNLAQGINPLEQRVPASPADAARR